MAEQLPQGNSDAGAGSGSSVQDKLEAMFDDGTPEAPEEKEPDAPVAGQEQPEDGEKPPAESTEVEVELDGQTYVVPKELKDAVLRHADYTKKTQEVAARASVVDAQMRMLQERQQFEQATAVEHQQLSQLAAAIQSYSRVDISQMDSETMLKAKIQLDNLKDQHAQLSQQLEAKRGQVRQSQAQALAEIREAGDKALRTAIPKWGPEVQQELATYGAGEGFTSEELSNLVDYRMVKTLWKAAQWDKLQRANPQDKRALATAKVVKPGSSNPQVSEAVSRMNFGKAMKAATTPQEKAKLIQQRLERLV